MSEVPRLPYIDSDVSGEVAEEIRARRAGRLTNLDRLLLQSPAIAAGWNHLLRAIRSEASLESDLREVAILRVAYANGADYEWAAHEAPGRAAGLSLEDFDAILGINTLNVLSPVRKAVVDYTDAMTNDVVVPDHVFSAIQSLLDDQALLELTVTVGCYNLVSRVLVALELTAVEYEMVQ